jgi:hypothetical protein
MRFLCTESVPNWPTIPTYHNITITNLWAIEKVVWKMQVSCQALWQTAHSTRELSTLLLRHHKVCNLNEAYHIIQVNLKPWYQLSDIPLMYFNSELSACGSLPYTLCNCSKTSMFQNVLEISWQETKSTLDSGKS